MDEANGERMESGGGMQSKMRKRKVVKDGLGEQEGRKSSSPCGIICRLSR